MNRPTSATVRSSTTASATTAPRAASTNWRRAVDFASVSALVVCAVILVRLFPVEHGLDRLREWMTGRGFAGLAAFVAAYVVAGLVFVPGAALTFSAGAVFGPATGTAIVSLASTATAAIAFLIARHVARRRVERWALASPRFAAIDRAIGSEGWKIVALLRLSPAMPFSLGNYLYGLTSIRFFPYLVTSWFFMLPGTLLYVFSGHVGASGLVESSASEGSGRFALVVVGLAATIVVTFFVTRLARRALAKRHEFAEVNASTEPRDPAPSEPRSGRTRTALLATFALAAIVVASVACSMREKIQSAFGPPRVRMTEAFSASVADGSFDHSAFDTLVREHVRLGQVDYAGLRSRAEDLDAYLRLLAAADFGTLSRDEKLAYLLNAYNACTLRLILDNYPVASIRDIPEDRRWKAERWNIAGGYYSLDRIENELIRPSFKDARIHFALVCAAVGCPPLRSEAYDGRRLHAQLDEQCRIAHSAARWFVYPPGSEEVQLTRLYEWYADDFRQTSGSSLRFAATYAPELRNALESGHVPAIRYLPYDWSLNDAGGVR